MESLELDDINRNFDNEYPDHLCYDILIVFLILQIIVIIESIIKLIIKSNLKLFDRLSHLVLDDPVIYPFGTGNFIHAEYQNIINEYNYYFELSQYNLSNKCFKEVNKQ